MKIQISDNLIRHYLRNVYFINGHSYAGKSTMVRMLSERYGMIPSSFANSMYVDQNKQNTIENFENDGEATVGLSTLLSAIGIHFGGEAE